MSLKTMEAPKCRLCEKNHWQREGCDFGSKRTPTPTEANGGATGLEARIPARAGRVGAPVPPQPNTRREGRRVLKGSTGKPAKPTRTASTERTDPPMPAKAPADRAIAEKAGVGIPKPRRKKKAKKKSKPPQESTR